jgi:hypothetical protein
LKALNLFLLGGTAPLELSLPVVGLNAVIPQKAAGNLKLPPKNIHKY